MCLDKYSAIGVNQQLLRNCGSFHNDFCLSFEACVPGESVERFRWKGMLPIL